jgi:phage major head subunit gpT-like protein
MAVVPSDLVTQWSTLFETLFLQEYNQTIAVEQARLAALIMELPLGDQMGNRVQLDWLGAAPQMREWVDEKRAIGLGNFAWSIVVKRYEASMDVDLDALRDAKFNPYEARLREMSANAARLRYNLLSDLIVGGAAALCYDGQYFFDVDHAERDSGTQSNKLAGTGTSQASVETDYYTAKSALMGFHDDKGAPLAPTDFRPLVWIPNNPTLEQRFRILQGASTISQTSNVLAGAFDLVVDPRLTDPNDWFMFRSDGAMRPFIVVNREESAYRDNFASGTDDVFKRRKGMASVEARLAATYGMWQRAVMVGN